MSARKLKRRAMEKWEWAFAHDAWRGLENWAFGEAEDLTGWEAA